MKFSLVLGGGFASNAYHAGVISVLEEKNIKPNHIVATSMASIAATLYASGKSSDEILKTVLSIKRGDLFSIREFIKAGKDFTTGKNFLKKIHKKCPLRTFNDLSIPLTLSALDLHSKQEVTLNEGDLKSALNGTLAYGILFKEVPRDNKLLIDIGFIRPLPTHLVSTDSNNQVIGSFVTGIDKPLTKINLLQIFKTTVSIHTNHLYNLKLAQYPPDILIDTKYPHYSNWTFKKHHLNTLYDLGRSRAQKLIN